MLHLVFCEGGAACRALDFCTAHLHMLAALLVGEGLITLFAGEFEFVEVGLLHLAQGSYT